MMALKVLQGRRAVVAYLPNLQAAVNHFRSFSTRDDAGNTEIQRIAESIAATKARSPWPDNVLGPFGPINKKFTLPGHVGLEDRTTVNILQPTRKSRSSRAAREVLDTELPEEKRLESLRQYLEAPYEFGEVETIQNTDKLECVAQECPPSLRRDFRLLFPGNDLAKSEDLTVITISQKTEHDMTGWSELVEQEREQLLDLFVKGATEICDALKDNGYWADFIDPSSGRPYNGGYTPATFFETDERYRKLGFDIDDLGCCKVIKHHKWGTKAYVGCIVTDAPVYHPIIAHMSESPLDEEFDYLTVEDKE